jgi:hypothetical protein
MGTRIHDGSLIQEIVVELGVFNVRRPTRF